MTQLTPAVHRTIIVVDVAGFTHPDRHAPDQFAVREGMYEVLKTAFAESDIDFDSCDSEDRGDGALILVPPTVSKSLIADRLPERLIASLRRYNATRVAKAQFKLRVGLHSGDIRHDGVGWVGNAVNLAFRILEAPDAKKELEESDRMVALISSEHFFTEVIEEDPGTVPESYRRIAVSVKKFNGTARLRLLGNGMPVSEPPIVPQERHDLLEVIPPGELDSLRDPLTSNNVPRLAVIISRAVGSAIPPPRHDDVHNAWDALMYLSEFNAGPDGVPPAVLFLELLAGEMGGELGDTITHWVDERARRMRLVTALEKRRQVRTPVPEEPHLHLTIMFEPDAIDPNRVVLSFWRQDDPTAWPPTRGGVLEATVDELEYRVDDVILDAEEVWAEQGISVAVEFLLPRTLLHLPVQRWRKEHGSGHPRFLHYDYRLTLRSLERMRTKHWRRVWHMRWDSMLENPSSDRVHYSGSVESEEHPIDAVLSDPRWVGLVAAETPTPQPEPGDSPDEYLAALSSGVPVILWHPEADPKDLRELIDWLLGGDGGFMDLPTRQKLAHSSSTVTFHESLVRDLVVMWDDPKRVIVLDQPLIPAQQ